MTSDPTLQVNSGEVAIIELNVEDVMLLESPGVTTPTLESEPTGVSVQPAAGRQQAQPIAIVSTPQIPPIILPKRRVSGRYRSTGTGFQLELRVDVDGSQPLNRVSGDFYQTSGGTTTYFVDRGRALERWVFETSRGRVDPEVYSARLSNS